MIQANHTTVLTVADSIARCSIGQVAIPAGYIMQRDGIVRTPGLLIQEQSIWAKPDWKQHRTH